MALAKQGVRGLNSFGKYAKDVTDVAKFNIWNRANKFRMEYPWQRKELLPQVSKHPFEFNSPLWTTDNLLNASTYRMLPSAYKDGGSLKLQIGGLVYKPFIPEKEKIVREATPAVFNDEETYSYTPEDNYELDIEPVLVYKGLNTKRGTVVPKEEVIEQTPIQVDKTAVKTTVKTPGLVEFARSSIDIGNMQELIDLMKEEGISFRITSGNRPGAKTKSGNTSHHSSGNALDITPASGQSWDDLIKQMKNSERFIAYMHDHNIGILDERSEEIQRKTGATGAHFHIGPDRLAILNFKHLIG